MQEKNIYIILTQTGTIVARIIKFFTKAPYNHSSISGDSSLDDMYSFCRYYKYSPLPAGFSQEHVNTCVFGMFSNIPCSIYKIPVTDEQYSRYRHLISYFKKETNNYSFNLMGFVGGILNVSIPRRSKFVCSQFVAYMLRESGIYTFTKDLFLITPNDFRDIPNAEIIFQGNLKDYNSLDNKLKAKKIPILTRKQII